MYLTTALPYVNDEPHIGHLYEVVVCDTLARHWRLREPTFFLTGTDEHGDKLARAAAAAGVSPREFVDRIAARFRSTWEACGMRFDHFVRTTDDSHVRLVQQVLQHVYDKGDIYFDRYSGLYCTGCERMYTEKELVDGKCPEHQRAPERIEEENYFFRMSKYRDPWLRHLEAHPETIVPDGYRKEVIGLLSGEALGDLCISRPKARLEWGVELPFDRNFVAYVWFDALFGYVSGLQQHGDEAFRSFWPQVRHIIGKDIIKPHGVFWPTILMAADLPLYAQLRVHGFWNSGASKMSKSLGNVVRPLDLRDRFGMEAVRYFLLREMAYGQDAAFSEDALVTRINADLANNLGNLVSRTLSMQHRYFGGIVQPLGAAMPEDRDLMACCAAAAAEAPGFFEDMAFHRALETIWRAIDLANKYIVVTAPFTLAKDEAQRPRVGAILHNLLEVLRLTAVLLQAALPETSARILRLLGRDGDAALVPGTDLQWGTHFLPGHTVGKSEILFPRIEVPPAA